MCEPVHSSSFPPSKAAVSCRNGLHSWRKGAIEEGCENGEPEANIYSPVPLQGRVVCRMLVQKDREMSQFITANE